MAIMRARERALSIPSMEALRAELGMGETYRTIAYMKAECASLAEQAWAARLTQTATRDIDAMSAAQESSG